MWWLLVVSIVFILLSIIIYYSYKAVGTSSIQDAFLRDAFTASGKLCFPKKDLRLYCQYREEVAPIECSIEEFQLRLRAASPELVIEMKKSLLRSAMRIQESYGRIYNEYISHMQLYKKLLLSPAQWSYIENTMEELKDTVQFIREEANFIQGNWGETIYMEARKLNEIRRKQEEIKILRERQIKEKEMILKKAKEQELVDDQRANEKAEELLKECSLEKAKNAKLKSSGTTQRKNRR
ncbi:hypothetical protein ACR3K2_06770 [Cryptosporidium serpentis]